MQRAIILAKIGSGLNIVGTPPPLVLGVAYTFTFIAKGGSGKYIWTETGALPTGVTFTDNGNGTATIAGTPSTSGSFPINVYVRNTSGSATNANFVIVVPPLQLFFLQIANVYRVLMTGQIKLQAKGGSGGYVYSVTSGMPAGMSINSATGVFTGTPTTIAANVNVVCKVTDSALNTSTVTFPIPVLTRLVITSPTNFGSMELNTNYSYQITIGLVAGVPGSIGTLGFSNTGGTGFPASVGVNISTGLISGSPTNHGNSNVATTVNVTDTGTGDTLAIGWNAFVHPLLTASPSTIAAGQNCVLGLPVVIDLHSHFGNGLGPYSLVNVSGDTQITTVGTTMTITGSSVGDYSDSWEVQDQLGQTAPFTFNYSVIDPNGTIQPQSNGSSSGLSKGSTTINYVGFSSVTSSSGITTITLSQATGAGNGYLSAADWNTFNNKAPTVSPTFTGVPVAPTAANGTNTTQLATCAFVLANGAGLSASTLTTSTTVLANGEFFVNANALTTTGPAAPTQGQILSFTFDPSVTSWTFNPNSLKIETTTGNMTHDVLMANGGLSPITLVYSNATDGWKFK